MWKNARLSVFVRCWKRVKASPFLPYTGAKATLRQADGTESNAFRFWILTAI